jgi:hypothetical protein
MMRVCVSTHTHTPLSERYMYDTAVYARVCGTARSVLEHTCILDIREIGAMAQALLVGKRASNLYSNFLRGAGPPNARCQSAAG